MLGSLGLAVCGGKAASVLEPVAPLAASASAQGAFRALDRRWRESSPDEWAGLEASLVQFLTDHGRDPTAGLVRTYLGWVVLTRHRPEEAIALVGPLVRKGPPGPTRDAALLVTAAIALENNDARRALAVLEALEGKLIDPVQQFLYAGQRARTEVELGHSAQAVRWMHRWLLAAPAHASRDTRNRVVELLGTTPWPSLGTEVLENELNPQDEAGPAEEAARRWLREQVRDRLAASAIEDQDRALAHRLLTQAPATWRAGKVGEAVAKIAAGTLSRPRIEGRAVGLAFSIGSEEARRRSAAVALGIARGLAAGEDRTPVRLLTREDGGDEGQLRDALSRLASDGAALVVAGVAPREASLAAEHAAETRVPTLLLSEPDTTPEPDGEAFVLGPSELEADRALTEAVRDLRAKAGAKVGGSSGVACDTVPNRPGQSRFPIEVWAKQRVDLVVLQGSPACTRGVIAELRRSGLRPGLVFGLECAELARDVAWLSPTWVLQVGSFPDARASSLPPGSLPGLGRPSFFELLGRDAATLARAALADVSAESVIEDSAEVEAIHRKVSHALASSRVKLETTEMTGFAGGRRLERRFELLSLSAQSENRVVHDR